MPRGTWVLIAKNHRALNYFMEFSLKQKVGSKGYSKLKRRAFFIKSGRHDLQQSAHLAASGGDLVALWRNGITHFHEFTLKLKIMQRLREDLIAANPGMDNLTIDKLVAVKMAKIWPIQRDVLVAIFIVNFPYFLPCMVELFLEKNLWERTSFHMFRPRHQIPLGDPAKRIAAFNAILVKLGWLCCIQGDDSDDDMIYTSNVLYYIGQFDNITGLDMFSTDEMEMDPPRDIHVRVDSLHEQNQLPLDAMVVAEPEMILNKRLVKNGKNSTRVEVLVKWFGSPASMSTWEDLYVLKSQYPTAPLWRQADSPGWRQAIFSGKAGEGSERGSITY